MRHANSTSETSSGFPAAAGRNLTQRPLDGKRGATCRNGTGSPRRTLCSDIGGHCLGSPPQLHPRRVRLGADDLVALTETERSLHGKIGAHTKWARTADWTAATAPARQAFLDRFEREVDPDGLLTPQERERRAASARKAYFTRLALASAKVRRGGDAA